MACFTQLISSTTKAKQTLLSHLFIYAFICWFIYLFVHLFTFRSSGFTSLLPLFRLLTKRNQIVAYCFLLAPLRVGFIFVSNLQWPSNDGLQFTIEFIEIDQQWNSRLTDGSNQIIKPRGESIKNSLINDQLEKKWRSKRSKRRGVELFVMQMRWRREGYVGPPPKMPSANSWPIIHVSFHFNSIRFRFPLFLTTLKNCPGTAPELLHNCSGTALELQSRERGE